MARDVTQVAIVGIGETDFSPESGRSALTLAGQAVTAALADAGLTAQDVDGIVRCHDDVVHHNDLAQIVGMRGVRYWSQAGPAGTAPAAMVANAVDAIVAGAADVVVAFRALNGRSGSRFGQGRLPQGDAIVGGELSGRYDEFFMPFGLTTPGQFYALLAQAHMNQYGTTHEQLGAIAVACRARANANPRAQMHSRAMSMEDYLDSPMLSEPLRLFDFCLETDGACAIVLARRDHALSGEQPPVPILAVEQGMGPTAQAGKLFPALMRDPLFPIASTEVAERLYRSAGLTPADIDVAQLYDCFTITVLTQLEAFGFCEPGDGGPFAESEIGLDGSLPVNTSGGHLSEGYIHGMNHILEGVRQMRGTSTAQVDQARTCLVSSGAPGATAGLILGRDR